MRFRVRERVTTTNPHRSLSTPGENAGLRDHPEKRTARKSSGPAIQVGRGSDLEVAMGETLDRPRAHKGKAES
jgi:hypothetical protein